MQNKDIYDNFSPYSRRVLGLTRNLLPQKPPVFLQILDILCESFPLRNMVHVDFGLYAEQDIFCNANKHYYLLTVSFFSTYELLCKLYAGSEMNKPDAIDKRIARRTGRSWIRTV